MQHEIILGEFRSHLHPCESEVGFWLWFLLLALQKGGWFGAPLSFKEKNLGGFVRVGEKRLKKWKRIIWTEHFSSPQRLLLGIISFKCDLLHSLFHIKSIPSNSRCIEPQKGRKGLISLFSLIFFGNHFNFFRVLIKEHAKEFFSPHSFFLHMFMQIRLDTLENQRIWLENTNLGNPSGQSSLPRYLAWFSSSVFVSDSGLCISTKTGTSWGEPVRDQVCPKPRAPGREGKGEGLGFSLEHGNGAVIFKSFCQQCF